MTQDITAFANSVGGKILIGVSDDGKIKGEKLTNSMKAEIVDLARNCDPSISISVKQVGDVVVVDIPEGDDKPYMCSSGVYKRMDAVTQKLGPKEINKIFRTAASSHFDARTSFNCELKDLSLNKVKEFIKETGTDIKITKKTLPHLLESLGLMVNKKMTNAAVMMFAENVGKFMFHCQMHLVAFKGIKRVNIYDKKYIRDDLLTQFREAEIFVQKHLNERADIRGMRRYDILEIPIEAIRETIVNAIIHRDYMKAGTNIQIEVLADRVVISNPGGLPESLPISMLGKKSVRRNDLLADLFHRMDKSEKIGSGIPRIVELMKSAKLKKPKFESDTFFTVTFDRPEEYRNVKTTEEYVGNEITSKSTQKKYPVKVPSKSTQKLGKTAQLVLNLITKNPKITREELAEEIGVSTDAVKKHLSNLKSKKILTRIGSDKNGSWELIE